MFPKLAVAGASRAVQVGVVMAPTFAKHAPKVVSVLRKFGRFALAWTGVSVVVDSAIVLLSRAITAVRNWRAGDKPVFTFRLGAVKDAAAFVASSAIQGLAELGWWLSLPILVGGHLVYLAGELTFGFASLLVGRVVFNWTADPWNRSRNLSRRVTYPFVLVAWASYRPMRLCSWASARYGRSRWTMVEVTITRMLVALDRNKSFTRTPDDVVPASWVDEQAQTAPVQKEEKVQTYDSAKATSNATEVDVTFDLDAINSNPKEYGRRTYDRLHAQHGVRAADAFRQVLPQQLHAAGVSGSKHALFLAGFDAASVRA